MFGGRIFGLVPIRQVLERGGHGVIVYSNKEMWSSGNVSTHIKSLANLTERYKSASQSDNTYIYKAIYLFLYCSNI